MTREEIVAIMQRSVEQRVRVRETDGLEWTGVVDEYESDYDNEDNDDVPDHSILATRDDGCGVLVYAEEIEHIEILE